MKLSIETQGGKRVDVERIGGFVYLSIVENAFTDYETETSVRLLESSLGGNEVDAVIDLLDFIKRGADAG